MSNLYCPNAEQIDDIWHIAAPLIQLALDRGSNFTLEDIRAGLKSREMQLWMHSDEAALVTTIKNDKFGTWCLLLAIGGVNMDEWIKYLPIVENWAKEKGCDEMRIYGRIGWAKRIDYNIDWTRLSKSLRD